MQGQPHRRIQFAPPDRWIKFDADESGAPTAGEKNNTFYIIDPAPSMTNVPPTTEAWKKKDKVIPRMYVEMPTRNADCSSKGASAASAAPVSAVAVENRNETVTASSLSHSPAVEAAPATTVTEQTQQQTERAETLARDRVEISYDYRPLRKQREQAESQENASKVSLVHVHEPIMPSTSRLPLRLGVLTLGFALSLRRRGRPHT
jgi:hypothetical protein